MQPDPLTAGLQEVAAGRGILVMIATPEQIAEVIHSLVPAMSETPPALQPHTPAVKLRDVETAALAAAPIGAEKALPMTKLARRAGYAYTPHFRDAVHDLEGRGLLRRCKQGYYRS